MLDDHHRVAGIDKPVQNRQQPFDVGKVQSGGRLVEQVHRSPGGPLHQLPGQLDPLGFTAGKRCGRLPEFEIVQPDVVQRLQHRADLGYILKMSERLLDVHLQHVGNPLTLEKDLKGLPIEPPAVAYRAGHPHVREELHLHLVAAVTPARLATAAAGPARVDVEAEPPGFIPPHF